MATTYSISPHESKLRRELLPGPYNFYKSELPWVSRPSRGWMRAACPFHHGNNKTAFSVNLHTGAFHCFSCQVSGGDVIDFVMLRDRLDFKQAAQSLGAWDDSTSRTDMLALMQQRDRRRQREEDVSRRHHKAMILERDYLHALQRQYRRTKRELHRIGPDHANADPCWELLSWLLPEIRHADANYRALAGLDPA